MDCMDSYLLRFTKFSVLTRQTTHTMQVASVCRLEGPEPNVFFLETRQIFETRWFLQLYKHHVSGESDDRMAKCWTLETVVTEDLNAAGFIKDFTTDSQATKLAVSSKSWQSGTPSTNPHQLTTPKVRGIPRVTQVFMAGMIGPKHTTIGGFTISPWVCTKCKR